MGDLVDAINEATDPVEYGPEFVTDVLEFFLANSEPLFSGQTTFFILGSYDDCPIRRLHFAENRLNQRRRTYAYVLCDLLDPDRLERGSDDGDEDANSDETGGGDGDATDGPKTHCKFYLLSTYSDYLIPIFEGRHAGPSVELGEIRNNFFGKTHAFRRDYDDLTEDDIRNDVDPSNPYSQPQEDLLTLLRRDGRLYEWADRSDLARAIKKLPTD
jgi:hypothetical protein